MRLAPAMRWKTLKTVRSAMMAVVKIRVGRSAARLRPWSLKVPIQKSTSPVTATTGVIMPTTVPSQLRPR